MSRPRGLQLSGTQVIASCLATLTGAIAASYLGVAGTLVGAAVGSIASTLGTAIYKHYLERSQERLRSAGQVLYHSAARTPTGDTMSPAGAETTAGGRHAASAARTGVPDQADRDPAVWDRRQYGAPRDPHETQMMPGLATQWGGAPGGGPADGGAATGTWARGGAPGGGPTNSGAANGGAANGGGPDDTASQHAHGNLTGEDPTGPTGDPPALTEGRGSIWAAITTFFGGLTRRQWLTYGGIAGAFFLIVVAAITIFELAIGKPLDQAVSGGHGSGTTVSNLFGHSATRKATTHPTSTPSATPTGSTPVSPTPSAGTSSGTPTPGASVAPSSPSAVPSATPSTGSSGAARSTPTP